MFKNFLIMSLTAIFSGSGCLPFIPTTPQESNTQYYCSSYSGYGTQVESHQEEFTYDSYTKTYTNIDTLVPKYSSSYGINGCTPTAGCIITAYYDSLYPNILPNYDPYVIYNNKVYWQAQNDTINNMQVELYNLMGTNTESAGTSVAQFKSGMTSYYNSKGYNITYNNVSSSITPTNAINWFTQEKPVILFLTSYDFYPSASFYIYDNNAVILGQRETAGHAVVACAYFEYTFYTDNEISRLDKWLYVSFGNGNYGYLSINNTSYIEEAYTFDISVRS